MINQTNIKNILFFSAIVFFGAILLFFFFLLRIERTNTKYGKLPNLEIKSEVSLRNIGTIVSIKTETNLPKTAKVYKVKQRYFGKKKASEVARKLGFQVEPEALNPKGSTPSLRWSQKGKSLNINETTGQVSFADPAAPISDKAQSFDSEEELINQAKQILTNLDLNSENFEADKHNISYFAGVGEDIYQTKDKEKAIFAEINFNVQISGKKLFLTQPSRSPIQFLLTKSGQVFQFYYKVSDYVDEGAAYPIKRLENLNSVAVKRYGVFVAPSSVNTLLNPKLTKDTTIEDIELIYVDDGVGIYLPPVYLLRGISTLGDEKVLSAVYLSAIDEGWLK